MTLPYVHVAHGVASVRRISSKSAVPASTATSVPARTATSVPARTATSVPARTATSVPARTATSVPACTATSLISSGQGIVLCSCLSTSNVQSSYERVVHLCMLLLNNTDLLTQWNKLSALCDFANVYMACHLVIYFQALLMSSCRRDGGTLCPLRTTSGYPSSFFHFPCGPVRWSSTPPKSPSFGGLHLRPPRCAVNCPESAAISPGPSWCGCRGGCSKSGSSAPILAAETTSWLPAASTLVCGRFWVCLHTIPLQLSTLSAQLAREKWSVGARLSWNSWTLATGASFQFYWLISKLCYKSVSIESGSIWIICLCVQSLVSVNILIFFFCVK